MRADPAIDCARAIAALRRGTAVGGSIRVAWHAPRSGCRPHSGNRAGAYGGWLGDGARHRRELRRRNQSGAPAQLFRPPAVGLVALLGGGASVPQPSGSRGPAAVHRAVRGEHLAAVPPDRAALQPSRGSLGGRRGESRAGVRGQHGRLGVTRRSARLRLARRRFVPGARPAGRQGRSGDKAILGPGGSGRGRAPDWRCSRNTRRC